MRRAAILGLVAVLSTNLPLHAQTPAASPTLQASDASALSAYEEGKKRYDAGDYPAARARFSEAVRREPDNPRWHYNLGLALRQSDNFQAARQSFLRARELAPDYKRAEIDQKLASMGFDPASGAESQPAGRNARLGGDEDDFEVPWGFILGGGFGLIILIGGGIALINRQTRRNPATMAARAAPLEAAALAAEETRLAALASQLIRVEHALRLGEHADLRSQLEYATRSEAAARHALAQARQGDRSARAKLARSLDDAGQAAQQATDLATRLYGERAFAAAGDKVGCFFCARPLANPETRQVLAMQRGSSRDEVLACPDCTARAGRGEAPAVRTGPDGQTHWSELPDYDPYVRRHADLGDCRDVPAWRYQPQRPLGEIARLAGGTALGLLAGAGTAMAAAALLDLDTAREAGLAHEALQASAKRAAEQRSEARLSDHS